MLRLRFFCRRPRVFRPLLPGRQEEMSLGYLPYPQSLNEPKSLNRAPSGTFGDTRSCLQPGPETVDVVEARVTVVHALDQMIANGCGDARPGLDLGHYSPKTRRPNSSPNRLACCGSLAARKRPASSKKDSPLVPDVSRGVSTKHHFGRSHRARSGPGSSRGRTKGVLDPRPWDRINR
jgi:hypothetical protein